MKRTKRNSVALVSILLALLMIMMSVPVMAAEGDEHATGTPVKVKNEDGVYETHYYDEQNGQVMVEPTCKKNGIVRYPCLDPDLHGDEEPWHEFIIAASPEYHQWEFNSDSASCATGGEAQEVCAICGEKRDRVIPKQPHTWGEPSKVELEDKTDKDGKLVEAEYYVILPEDYFENQEDYDKAWAAKDVKFAVTKAPTCRKEGIATYTCLVCGETKTKTIKVVPTAHVWDGPIVDKNDENCKAATCAETGKAVHYCSECATKSYVELPKLKAKWVVVETKLDDCYHITTTKYCAHCEANKTTTHGTKKNPTVTTEELEIGAHEFDLNDTTYLAPLGAKKDKYKSYNITVNETVVWENGNKVSAEWEVVTANCDEDGRAVYVCKHCFAEETKSDADKAAAHKTVTLKAPGHKWGKWILRYEIGEGANEYAYYIRECSVCHMTQELITKEDPNAEGTEIKPVSEFKFTVDASALENGAGVATVKVEGDMDGLEVSALEGRITYVYKLSDGNTMAVVINAPVEKDLTIKVGGVQTPRGATLVETQVALTDTKDSRMSGKYNYLAGDKK